MKKSIIFLLITMLFSACAATKTVYVPAETVHKIEYRDSLIRVIDTVKVEIPKEKIVEVIPQIDTSRIETKIAYSVAYLDTDNKVIHHTLENKPEGLKTIIDTVVVIKTRTEYMEKPYIQEIEVPTPYIPKIFWAALWFSIGVIILIFLKLYLKFKGL